MDKSLRVKCTQLECVYGSNLYRNINNYRRSRESNEETESIWTKHTHLSLVMQCQYENNIIIFMYICLYWKLHTYH